MGSDWGKVSDTPVAEVVGVNLTNALRDADMRPRDLGERLGVATTTVYQWVRGREAPTLGELVAIAKTIGVDPTTLLVWDWGIDDQTP